jgi:hypothetical protein
LYLLEVGEELGYPAQEVTYRSLMGVNLSSCIDKIPGREFVGDQLLASIGVVSDSGCHFSRLLFYVNVIGMFFNILF